MGVTDDGMGLRLPEVEWAYQSGQGELDQLQWVDGRLDPNLPPLRAVGVNGDTQFRHYAYLTVVPTYLADIAQDDQERGRPTAWEALTLLFARPEWTVASRNMLWAPHSPYPGVLAQMVEAFGVERNTHRFDRARLARLAALLPSWYPGRGRLDAAREVLSACDELDTVGVIHGQNDEAPEALVKNEILCCRGADWWRARQQKGAAPSYRISKGFVRYQDEEGPGWQMRHEDFLVQLPTDGKLSLSVHRLLPAWASVRLTTEPEASSKKAAAQKATTAKKPAATVPTKAASSPESETQDALVPMDELDLLELDDAGAVLSQDDDQVLELEEMELEPIPDVTIVPEDEAEDSETDLPAPSRKKNPKGENKK